ncbi:hypothetical protein [Coleofasciculus sp. D1-CHI-01]|uniref:hypothetical protein n=1 Tax=Coleofasciculus sp. D1-CHI-01 TaxID=3068482 RepID=UPI004064B70E
MSVDLLAFFKATNPGQTINIADPEDRKYYIDFSPVRGGTIIEELKENVIATVPDFSDSKSGKDSG